MRLQMKFGSGWSAARCEGCVSGRCKAPEGRRNQRGSSALTKTDQKFAPAMIDTVKSSTAKIDNRMIDGTKINGLKIVALRIVASKIAALVVDGLRRLRCPAQSDFPQAYCLAKLGV
jgi:hypothetical protein